MKIGVLGAVTLWHGGAALSAGSPLQQAVLGVLALDAGEPVPAERLVELLWDDPPPDVRGQIQTYVSRLRRRLAPMQLHIERRTGGYVLTATPADVDVHVFRSGVAAARSVIDPETAVHQWRELAGLWRGEPLAGAGSALSLGNVRAALAQERLGALEEWASAELAVGQHQAVVPELLHLADAEPLRERLQAHAMLALYQCGRQAEALQRFESVRIRLADDLGVDPSPELRQLYQRILRAEPSLDPTAPVPASRVSQNETTHSPVNTLPYGIPDFRGRSHELETLVTTLPTEWGTSVMCVDGMAGVGKTALVVHAAHRLATTFPDAQLFVDLHGFTPGREPLDSHAALDTLIRSLGVPAEQIPIASDQRAALWRSLMADRRAVVVLDNAAEPSQVRDLVPGSQHCLVLVTSRRRLVTLDGAVLMSLDVLTGAEARSLFVAIAGPTAESDPAGVGQVVDLCGYLPLAIRIAGARMRHRPAWRVSDLAHRLEVEQTRLSELAVDDRDVAAAFALSYRYASADARRVFRLMGVLPGPDTDVHAAAALTDLSVPEVERLMESLLDDHLLLQQRVGRYTMHDLLRVHSRTLCLDEEPTASREVGADRLLDHYLVMAARAADVLQPGRRQMDLPVVHVPSTAPEPADHRAAIAWFDDEHPNLLAAAILASRRGKNGHAHHLPRNIGHYLITTNRLHDLVALQRLAVDATRRAGDRQSEALNLHNLAMAYQQIGENHRARTCSQASLELCRTLGDSVGVGFALTMLGMCDQLTGRFASALDHFDRAMELQKEIGDRRNYVINVANVADVRLVQGDHQEAARLAERGITLSREWGEQSELSWNCALLGSALVQADSTEQGFAMIREGLEVATAIGNHGYEVKALVRLADAMRRTGAHGGMAEVVRRVRPHLPVGQVSIDRIELDNIIGMARTTDGDARAALRYHQRALDGAERHEFRYEQARALAGTARAHLQLGDHEAAASAWQSADLMYREMGLVLEPLRPVRSVPA